MLQEVYKGRAKWNQKLTSLLMLFVFLVSGTCDYSMADTQTQNKIKAFSADGLKTALVTGGKAASVYIDPNGKDYDGLSLIAKSFAGDVNLVSGVTPDILTDASKLTGTAVIAGSIGNNSIIDSLISSGKLDVTNIKGKWECYKIQVVSQPVSGVDKAIVIVGSDKRGTIYGIYHISELMGVSPWVYWGDVTPAKQTEIVFDNNQLDMTSKEPSVKYRGIFLNDEYPSLGNWANRKFGGFNENFYKNVYELILRLKGNYLWPAMWSASFSDNGKSSKTANAELANKYGIVMGTSHHEPMCRAGVEWQKIYKNYGKSNEWDFSKNADAITKFWEDGIKRNKDFDNLITVGMRGESDSALTGTDEDNINLLKRVITTQKAILSKYGLENSPQVLTLYKEVEKYWYGTDKTPGLKDWDVLNDVTIMLSEDNFANTRTLPTAEEKNRKAGWGMYYHFDYHGGPRSYEWVNTVPLNKVWEQMSQAYDYGVKNIWIVNVGDLKPMELPTSYFMDLAYDFDQWGAKGRNKTEEYTREWSKQQFGASLDSTACDQIAAILTDYTRMNGNRKPEITYSDTYSFTNYNEAQRVLSKAINLKLRAQSYLDQMPASCKDTYYQLVYYPAAASANIQMMQIYAGLNHLYYNRNSVLANKYAELVKQCVDADKQMEAYYNNTMSGGKWNGMMSSYHVGYTNWDSTGWSYPKTSKVKAKKEASMIVDAEGTQDAYSEGTASLPEFTSTGNESYSVTISNGGKKRFDYKISSNADWIKVDSMEGSITDGKTLMVSVDWSKVPQTSKGVLTITGANKTVKVNVNAKVIDTAGLPKNTFVEAHDVVSVEAEHTSNNVKRSDVQWEAINNYGKTLSSIKMFPTTVSFTDVKDAPYVEYSIYVDEDSNYTLTAYAAPSNNTSNNGRLRYAVAFDDGTPVVADTLSKNFVSGDYNNAAWNNGVMDNIHISTTTHKLTKGVHTLRFYGMDAGVVLQKLVLSNKALPSSYFGPEESYCTK